MLWFYVLATVAPVFGASGSSKRAQKPQMGTCKPHISVRERDFTDLRAGWNSWNTFKLGINQTIVEGTAQALVDTGLRDAGYTYLVMDDGWQNLTRGPDGRQQANATRFPSGLKVLADEVHKKGLKFGLYRLGYGLSEGFYGNTRPLQERFQIMSHALKNTGRDIFYAVCQWGHQWPWYWADQFTDSYRMSGDIHAKFRDDGNSVCKTAYCLNTGYAGVSVLTMIRKMREISGFQKKGSWADMDMLEVGVNRNFTLHQDQTHLSFWAALKSPLIIGADIRTIRKSSLDVLLKKDIIGINQDDLGVAVSYVAELSKEDEIQVWAGPVKYKKYNHVVLALNYNVVNHTTDIELPWSKLPGFQGCKNGNVRVRDVWEDKDLGSQKESISLQEVTQDQTKVLLLFCK
ncbi:alpha-galactosidase [Verticillium alfalfae VaMs.102]|uniref:Alpha-galactosidase n=1 Tax=Verticillium alfalfae (strain VaMs.102 / ATCC MYA-4576 / FGSC 10136) TaxID=526221 RepID=C9SXM3_VERA1|nr:alpha-galactosidase [Verticillium alfalfae VaMs.102]EEY23413.1 alpha-galactosidase [Verticillium alfalfae VaMs.102]